MLPASTLKVGTLALRTCTGAPRTPTRCSSPLQEQEQKLRGEYLGLGGSANSPIPNYFLYIIVGISFLAVSICLRGMRCF